MQGDIFKGFRQPVLTVRVDSVAELQHLTAPP